MPSTNWFEVDGCNHLQKLAQLVLQLLFCIATSTLIFIICVNFCLLKRFVQIHFGKRIQPDGSRAVVITGATSGFGLATAKRLYARGFTVFACYYNDQEAGYKELSDIKLAGSSSLPDRKAANVIKHQHLFLVKMDVRSSESIKSSAREIQELLQLHNLRLHCLLNNAGICADGPFEFSNSQSIRNLLDTNVAGVYQVTKEFILRIIKDKGRVVNVSSGVSLYPGRTISLYGSSKAAVSYFSDSLNQDLKPYGAACYTIVPGNFILHSNIIFTRINFLQNSVAQLSDEERQVYRSKIGETTESLYGLLKRRLANTKEDPKMLADLYGISLAELDNIGELSSSERPSLLQSFLFRVVKFSDGSSGGHVDLENTGVIDCFERAVVSTRPPRHTFAGNSFYQFLAGPIVDYLPKFMFTHVGNHMISTLVQSK